LDGGVLSGRRLRSFYWKLEKLVKSLARVAREKHLDPDNKLPLPCNEKLAKLTKVFKTFS